MRHQSVSILSSGLLCFYGCIFYGCSTTPKQAEQADSSAVRRTEQYAQSGQAADNSSPASIAPQVLIINEATVVLAFEKEMPEKICERFAPDELVRMLYANEIKPDDKSTFTITDIQVTQLNASSRAYMAVVKREKIGNSEECLFDIFAFRDSTNTNPVLAHTTYEPEFADADIVGVQQKKYQISDEEYALSFEWTATQGSDEQPQTTTMLCLFRAQNDIMQPIFEVCTATNAVKTAASESENDVITEDRATIETMKTWGKDLYSILVTRTQSRKSSGNNNINTRSETNKSKTLYQWDGMQYIQTNQLL
jgi:hypothetical protein